MASFGYKYDVGPGYKKAIRDLGGFSLNKRSRDAKMTYGKAVAKAFKERLKVNLKKTTTQGGAHNTPTPLIKGFHFKTNPLSGKVDLWMDDIDGLEPAWVEFGTRRHAQKSNPIYGQGRKKDGKKMHPGSKPKLFWGKTILRTKRGGVLTKAGRNALKILAMKKGSVKK